MRMRNWGHSSRIHAGFKAPSLNGRASLDEWASWFSADMAGEEKCTVSLKLGGQRLTRGIQESCFLFQGRSRIMFPFPDADWRWFLKGCHAMYLQERPDNLLVDTPSWPQSSTISLVIYPWHCKFESDTHWQHQSEHRGQPEFMMAAKLGWTHSTIHMNVS
jgi:hypothetical protein